MEYKFLLDGKIVDSKSAVVPAANKASFFSYGIYESLRVFRGKIFYPEWHMARFISSAATLEMELPYSKAELLGMLDSLVKENSLSDALIRLVYYGATEKEEGILAGFPMGFHFYPDKAYRQGERAIIYNLERMLPQAKTLNLLGGFLALREATRKKSIEAILLDRNGNATEGTRSNLFIVDSFGEVITAPKTHVLEGITRKVLMENHPDGIVMREHEIPLLSLYGAREAFLTSTVFGVMPIVEVDGHKIADGKVGEKTKALSAIYERHIKEYCAGK